MHRRNIIILAALLLILTAVCRVPISGNVRLSFQLLFQISIAVLLAYAIWFFGNKWLAGLLILSTISCFYPTLSISSFITFQLVVFGAVWYLILVYALKPKWVNILLDAMCIIALCNVLYQTGQRFHFDLIYKDGGKTVGLMSNPNELSALLAFCLPAFFRKTWVWFIPVVVLGFLTLGGAKGSFGGVVASLAAVTVFMFKFERKWIGIAGIAGAIIVGFLFFNYNDGATISGRLKVWLVGWNLYRENGFFGFGLGNWSVVFFDSELRQVLGTWFAHAHNDLLQGVFEMGISFAVLTVGYFGSIVRRINKKAILSLAAITAIVVNSLVNFPFHIAITAMIAVTWMAILDVELNDSKAIS